MPASSGSARYSTDSRPKRRRKKSPIDSSSVGPRRRRRSTRSRLTRSLPAGEKRRVVRNGAMRVGMPRTEASGSGWRIPDRRMNAVLGVNVGTRRSPSPSSRQRSMAAGFWTRSASGPASIVNPSIRSVRMTPPRRGAASNSRKVTRRRCSSYAVARPAMPPPTTATSTLSTAAGCSPSADFDRADARSGRAPAHARPVYWAGSRARD